MSQTPPVDALTPYDLRCGARATPLGVGCSAPELTWRLRSPHRGDAPARVRATVSLDGVRGSAEIWSSGWVAPPEPRPGLRYDGLPLTSLARYTWTVEVESTLTGEVREARSWFETGVLHPAEWTAAWIEHDVVNDPAKNPPAEDDLTFRTRFLPPPTLMRRQFSLGQAPVRARLVVSARGLVEVRLNGARVGDDELVPGWTNYHERVQYHVFDATEQLAAGENVLGAVLADGWWSGYLGFKPRRQGEQYGHTPQLLVQLVLDFPDGARRVVVTDDGWREATGPLRYADLFAGERYDARLELPGWDRPGFDASGWGRVYVADHDHSTLVPLRDEPVRVVDELQPVETRAAPGGGVLLDFGQNLVGRLRVELTGLRAGTRVQLRHAEAVHPDGTLYTENLRTAECTDVYFAAGRDVETYEPRFTFHGFRYAEITGLPEGAAVTATASVLRSDFDWSGQFTCDDPLVDRLQSNVRWGLAGNFVSIPTDCPQRDERMGWLADAQVFLPTAIMNADVEAFISRWLLDVYDAQTAEGAFPNWAPAFGPRQLGAPAWGDGGVIIPWLLYREYGDLATLRRCFPGMCRWVDHVHRNNPGLIWREAVGNNYGDWLQIGADTSRDLLATAHFARSADLVARSAAALGMAEAADRYAQLAADVREAFCREFVDEKGRVQGETQTGYLLALAWDVLPEVLRPLAVEHLADDVESRGTRLTTGFVGVALLCPTLARFGRADLAHALLVQEEFPSWGYSIKHGATTIWERWDGWTSENGFQSANMNSFNHYSLGSVGEWLYAGVAGIAQAPGSVAYRDLLVQPRIVGRLRRAGATFDSVRGRIGSAWERDGSRVRLDVEIPPGSTARVVLPARLSSVTEGGRALSEVPEVEPVPGEDVTFRVASGHYRFEFDLTGDAR